MTDDVTARVLRLFEVRLKNDPDISPETVEVLLEGDHGNDFGDDEEILQRLVDEREFDR